MQPSLDVVIVNWNAGVSLRSCLASVVDSAAGSCSLNRVVVVDNASVDDCVRVIDGFAGVELLQNTVNRGFAAGCNAGARHSRADYLLFLNPDVVVTRHAIEKVISFLERPQAQHIGICGIRLSNAGGHSALCCSRFPTLRSLLFEMAGLERIAPSIFQPRDMETAELHSSREVDQVIGAFFVVRRALFEALGGFDESFFVYFEDVDFSLRARRQGWASYFLAEAEAMHLGQVSSNQSKGLRLPYFVRSRLIYCRKHFGPAAFGTVLLFSMLIEPAARVLHAIAGHSQSSLTHVLQGYGKLYAAVARSAWRKAQRMVFSGGPA